MLSVTDSRFQAELLSKAKDAGKVEKNFELPKNVRDNTPDRIARALTPVRAGGHLPVFPLGTDFTETEQKLLPALGTLSTASPLTLARLALRGMSATTTPAMQECLSRMGLDVPKTMADRISAFALRGALAQTLRA
jgi:hypothetical protein